MQADMAELVLKFAEKRTPIAQTKFIGHGTDSKAIRIGHHLKLYSAEANKRIYNTITVRDFTRHIHRRSSQHSTELTANYD